MKSENISPPTPPTPPSVNKEILSLSMFQCMVYTDKLNLRDCWKRLYEEKEYAPHLTTTTNTKAFQPGSLGSCLDYEETVIKNIYQIGSLSVKFNLCEGIKISLLVFNTGKIKISGGLGKLECDNKMNDKEFDAFLQKVIIVPSLKRIFGDDDMTVTNYKLQKKIINANLRREHPIGKNKYMKFINDLTSSFGHRQIILPEIMQENGKRRGRICAVKVKNSKGRNGSFAVDHSGNVQFFAYNNIEHLKDHVDELMKVWL